MLSGGPGWLKPLAAATGKVGDHVAALPEKGGAVNAAAGSAEAHRPAVRKEFVISVPAFPGEGVGAPQGA
jgi:hypothetical protein